MRIGFWHTNIQSNAAPTRCLRTTIKNVNNIKGVTAVHGGGDAEGLSDVKSSQSDTPVEFVNEQNLDVIHWNKLYDYTNPSKIDIPKLLTYHGDIQWEYPKLNYGDHPLIRSYKERAVDLSKIWMFDAVLFPSNNIMRRSIKRFGRLLPDSYVVNNAPMTHIQQAFNENVLDNYNVEQPYVFHLSSKGEKKNVHRTVKAFNKIDEDVNLVIGGGGWESEEFESDNVKTVGYIPDEDLKYFYSHAEAFIFASLHESFGIPPVESLRCGVTPVVSNKYSLPEVTQPESILCDPVDETSIANGIREAMNRNIEPRFKYRWDDSAKQIVSISRSLK